ncbi:hypothetical protein S4A8_14669 [Salinisphaera sp. S4-8]|uniref:thioesterase family protein n=1 Tax=Salinisphaera sp. S4-8 TaxID=633357 RepID=UPI003341E1F3
MNDTTHSIFERDGDYFVPTRLARGPWDENALHGGAPAALLAHVAEQTAGAEFTLARLTIELTRPVPLAALRVKAEASRGRSARRITLQMEHDGAPVARAIAVMLCEQPVAVPPQPDKTLEPAPADCDGGFDIAGMPRGAFFHEQGMEIRLARGSTREAGPAAAWLRLRVPAIDGIATTGAMRAAAAADFGNGLSWVLPFDRYLFTNTDLTVYLHRMPAGEWVGVDAQTIAQPSGIGLSSATLYDTSGVIGHAHQNLLIRKR